MKIITSLGSAVLMVARGELNENEIFIVASTRVSTKEKLEELIKDYSSWRWVYLTEEQEEQVNCIDDLEESFAKEESFHRENAILCGEICRRLFANSRVFQYRLIELTDMRKYNYKLWCHDYGSSSNIIRLNVNNSPDQLVYSKLNEYVEWYQENELAEWLDYLFPNGLNSIEQLESLATRLD